jgi:DNA-binding beta-propeller fold protein YncE
MRCIRMFAIACVAALGVMACGASFAQATETLEKLGEFPTGIAPLSAPTGIAFNESNHDVWVANNGLGSVVELNSAGTSVEHEITGVSGHLNIAVDNSSSTSKEDVYVPSNENPALQGVKKYGPNGEFICELNVTCSGTNTTAFSEPEGVAVDPATGQVYVADTGNNAIDVFSPEGEFVKAISGVENPRDIKVDSNGNVYVAVKGLGGASVGTEKFAPSETPVTGSTTWTPSTLSAVNNNTTAIAIDSADDVYVANYNGATDVVTEYNSAGTEIAEFNPGGEAILGYGMAVDNATNQVYISNIGTSKVVIFGKGAAKQPLTVEVEGEGKITSAPAGIECPGTCEGQFTEGAEVTLKATEAASWKFKEWAAGGACEGSTEQECKVTMSAAEKAKAVFTEIPLHAFPLTVFVTGEGKVKGATAIECGPAGTPKCSEEVEGEVTLTPTAEPGSVFAGWLGCKNTVGGTCKIDVSAATEVIAVFLKEGTQGIQGPQGPQGNPGTNGKNGTTGENGANGSNGVTGAQGPAGPAGPAGKVQIVTCTKSGKKKKCTTKTVSGTVKFTTSSAQATLSRHGVVFAAGTASDARGRMSLQLTSLRTLEPGRYTLTLISGSGRNETLRSEGITLR